jgi:uncharacterized repeat protein (TIGR01451 family)
MERAREREAASRVAQRIIFILLILVFATLTDTAVLADDETLCFTERVTDAPSFNIYTGRGDANNPITWEHTVPAGLLDSVVRVGIYIEAYDVDSSSGEDDRVYFNGYDLGLLEGVNDSWITVEKTVPVEAIQEGINNLSVDVDEGNDGWKVTIRASELRFYCSTPDPDFSIGVTPQSLTITQGQQDTATVETIALNGFADSVDLSVDGMPSGLTADFAQNPLWPNPASSTTVTFRASGSVQPGTYTLNVVGQNGALVHQDSLQVTIEKLLVPDFSLQAEPESLSITQGEQDTVDVNVTSIDGFSDPVDLTVTGLPNGMTADFSTSPVTPDPSASATLTIDTSDSVSPGTYQLTITGQSGSLSHDEIIEITIEQKLFPDFSIETTPESLSITQGQQATVDVDVNSIDGFSDPVDLSISGLPSGLTGDFSSSLVTPGSSTVLTLQAAETATTGVYQVTVSGLSGALNHDVNVQVTIERKLVPDFTLEVTPETLSLTQGQEGELKVDLTSIDGFSDPVELSVSGLPAGITTRFATNSQVPDPSVSVVLSVEVADSVKAGQYQFTVTGIGGDLTHSAIVTLTVIEPDYTIAIEADPLRGRPPLEVEFEAIMSPDPPADTEYEWVFDDDQTGDGDSIVHTFKDEGTYIVRVRATLPSGTEYEATRAIEAVGYNGTAVLNFKPARIHPGEQTNLSIRINNPQQFDIEDLVLNLELHPQLQLLEQQNQFETNVNGRRIESAIPLIASGESVDLSFRLKVDENAEKQSIGQTAWLSHNSLKEDIVSDPASLMILEKELILRKKVDKRQAKSGDRLRYTITLENPYEVPLKNIVLRDELHNRLEFVSASGPLKFSRTNNQLRFSGSLTTGKQYSWQIVAKVRDDAYAGEKITNRAVADLDDLSKTLRSNISETEIIGEMVEVGQVVLNHRTEIPQADVGRIVRLRITVQNNSPSNLANPAIEVLLPTGFDYVKGSSLWNNQKISDPEGRGRLRWKVDAISARRSATLRYQVVIGASSRRGKNLLRADLDARDSNRQRVDASADAFVNVAAPGLVFYSGVEGVVYLDKDGDGMYSPMDQTLSGIEVVVSNGERITTGNDGRFKLSGLYAGEYAIGINRASLGDKFRVPYPQIQTVMLADGFTDWIELPVYLVREDQEKPCSINGRVFYDKNKNGMFDEGEPLAQKFNARLDEKMVTAGSGGRFIFKHLEKGKHVIEIFYDNKEIRVEVDLGHGKNNIDIPLKFTGITVIVEGEGK